VASSGKVWEDDQEVELIAMYREVGNDGLEEIAEHFGKRTRNIISKLVQLKEYIKPVIEKPEKRTVKMMLNELEGILDIEIEGQNLTKKSNLERIVDAIKEKLEGPQA
jgi:hypothetical protein